MTLTIRLDNGTEHEFDFMPDCTECKEAIEHFVNIELKRERGSNSIFNRIPLILLRDPDYRTVVHIEKLDVNLSELREILK
jgi:hypothetical protein